ncbi:CDK5 regulatory subunit-associated protein 2 isoform X3 [Phycodurus eques]|uniref:CDK5 regulatory subunit-associated protein 2 isoform X3 n=1 Tax=Phycodurus eques TaxID=693459 RepID=UPI002ACEF186|nr:CDK5 regulatory subunit-associated protein 2 isoform X3 [Phycodurus eques]
MKDSCRVCSGRLVGNQCRWIFSSAAKRKLQIILSHVLGREVTRDGRGEFLCGKCVFQLEKVIQCDVNLSQLQEQHNSQVQKIQAEKAHLIQCIIHVYSKHNLDLEKSDEDSVRSKTSLRLSGAASFDDEATSLLLDDAQSAREGISSHRMRRCVSLDRLVSKGVFPGRSGLKKWRVGSAVGLDRPMKSCGLRASRGCSQSMYLDLVHYKGTFPRHGFKGRSASLQSLNRDFDSPEATPRKTKVREAKTFVLRNVATDDPMGKAQAKALLRSSSRQPSMISDLIQLLRCISKQGVSVPAGSRIPVLKRFSTGHSHACNKRVRREAKWKSLHDLTEEFDDQYTPATAESELHRLESINKQLNEELIQAKSTHENLTKTLEETESESKTLSVRLDERENELHREKKNGLKRDKTIQGLMQVLKEKEKEIAELCHEIEDRDDALAKARETAHKVQMQKYQGTEEHQTLLMAKQTELVQLQGEHHAKVLEAQKLQRALDRREQELSDLQRAKEQLEVELEDLQQQKKKGDKAVNDLNNQLKKLSSEIGERESFLEQHYQELLHQTQRKVQAHEVTIQRLTSTLADKEQQLQEYINMVRDIEEKKSPLGNDSMLAKLRQRLKEKEKALEQALDERFVAIEEKDNEIHQLQLSLREKERDLERLNSLLSRNEETINSFDSLIKEKDVELQHLANTLKNLQRAKQDVEDNLNRSLREKDAIISQLQLSLDGKTKDLEEMSESVPSKSQSYDLAEQMGQRLKVKEAMLAEAMNARERLVADNEAAVEGLLATINSKDQLIKESAEHYNRMLSERSKEIQELRRQLSDRQQQLTAAERQCSTAAQKDSLETAKLRELLAEKDSIIDRLLQRAEETEYDKEPDYVLDLRQTIQIMQEKLDGQEAELSRRNSDESVESIPLSKKTVVILKKELAQKTEALNKAVKRENELKMSLVELQSLLSELEGRSEGQAANIESLVATLETKDEIIHDLQQRLCQPGDTQGDRAQDRVIGSSMDRLPSGLPQRERTMIGGDSQQEALPSLVALQQEHKALNKALRAEQQLYSSLVRTVKEQDSAQRLHALQLELTAVQLLRQQLEDGIKANEELRDDLERELDRAKVREGVSVVDPKELESVQHQLEDAQRWNASLQARFGAIQNRGGGVGGANDCGDSLSFAGDQTSYMSICVGEGHDDRSHQELKQKVLELQDCVKRLQAINKEEKNPASGHPWKQQPDTTRITEVPPVDDQTRRSQDQASQTDISLGQSPVDESVDSGLGQSREHAQCAAAETDSVNCLLTDSGATSLLQLREEVVRLKAENVQLRGLLKEQKSSESKEKESTDASGNSSDGQAELRRSRETLRAQTKDKEEEGAKDRGTLVTTEGVGTLQAGHHSKITNHRAGLRSRLPVPVRPRAEACSDTHSEPCKADAAQHLHTDSDQKSFGDSTASSQPSAGPSSSHGHAHDSSYPATRTPDDTQAHAALFAQLELLHQECQDKEALINKLGEQLVDWEELHAQLRDKEHLNSQYVVALKAAESTIAYLTACSLDSQGGSGPGAGSASVTCNSTHLDLQKVLHEKEVISKQLTQHLNLAEKHISSPDSQEKRAEFADLRLKIEAVNASSNEQRSLAVFGGPEGLVQNDSLQGRPRQRNSTQTASESLTEKELKDQRSTSESSNLVSNKGMTKVLAKCLSLVESVIASLAAVCTNNSSFTNPELQEHLDNLQRALQNRQELEHLTQATQPSSHSEELLNSELHRNLRLLSKVLADHSQRICELQATLQEERARREESEAHAALSDAKGLAPNVQAQLETLHKALREKKKACKNLEEKLATAQSTPSPNNTTRKAVEQDDKSVQVDLQDLGYETTGKSENDREESSSTVFKESLFYYPHPSTDPDLEIGVKASGSASSLPLLLSQEQAHFSSTEHLDSTSSTPYPSSPTLSSAKISLKSLQTYEEYGLSEDPLQLQAQVRELKIQLESQTKLVSQMQSLVRRNSINLVAGHRSDQSTNRDGTQGRHPRPSREQMRENEGDGKDQSIRSEASEAAGKKGMKEQLQHSRSRSTSPASLDSLVQSQARELSQLRQQIKESRRLGSLQRRQMGELSRAFQELLQSSQVDCYMGEVVKGQLDKTLSILDRLEGRLDKGETHQDNEDVASLDRSRRLAKELQEKNRLIQSLQSQVRGQSPSSPHSSHSDGHPSDGAASSCYGSPPVQGGGTEAAGVSGDQEAGGRLLGLQRENGLLHERLRSSEHLNGSLRSELELHLSVMAHQQDRDSLTQATKRAEGGGSAAIASAEARAVDSDLLAEHLEEIRALRRRLEESISTNDRLREQLERRLAEVEKDTATNIFIHGNEDQAQLVNEVRFLWGQNQDLKEQLQQESKDKQRERERLRDNLARRTAKLEQSRQESDVLRQENARLRDKLDLGGRENARLLRSLRASEDRLRSLQCEAKLLRQQVTDSQRLLQSLRVELQVHEKMETATQGQTGSTTQDPARPPSGTPDLSELLSEIRRLRLQLERSIRANTTLRQRLEEQLWRGAGHSETINVNYLLSSADEGSGPPGREGADVLVHGDGANGNRARCEVGGDGGGSSSSGESVTAAPYRLVPGHRLWANRNGRHILALVEDYSALRRHISEGCKLSRGMDVRLHQCFNSKVMDEESVKLLSGDVSTVQQVLDEAARLLKLVWRVSLPAGGAGAGGNNQQDDLKKEISRLKSRLSQQERMLSGAVKRLRTTNQLKEGMERVIVDQLSLTHGVLKKARGNLEKNHCYLFGPQGPTGGQGGACKWPIGGVDVYTSDEQ